MVLTRYLILAVVVMVELGCVANPKAYNRSVDPERSAAQHIQLAMRYIGSNKPDLARVHLQKAERFDFQTGRSQLYNGWALLYQMERDADVAEEYYRKAVSADKNDSVARYNYAAFLYNQGRFKQTQQQIQRVIEDPRYRRRAQAFYILGLAQGKTDQLVGALKSFAKANQLTPVFAAPYIEAAEIYFVQNKLLLAKRHLQQYGNLQRPSARSLWLGVRIDDSLGDSGAAARRGLQLQKLFPDASETGEYLQWLTQQVNTAVREY
jgi:type IV pilus assembly protein PilF